MSEASTKQEDHQQPTGASHSYTRKLRTWLSTITQLPNREERAMNLHKLVLVAIDIIKNYEGIIKDDEERLQWYRENFVEHMKVNHVQERVVAWYGPGEDQDHVHTLRWLSAEQVDPFLQSLPRRILPLEVTENPDHPISCLMVEYGKRRSHRRDGRSGEIIAVGTNATFTPRQLFALAEGKPREEVRDQWECCLCHREKYRQRDLLGDGRYGRYGRYGTPMERHCRVHGLSLHSRVYTDDEAEMMDKCARSCHIDGLPRCVGHCQAYWERQERRLLAGIYSLPDEEQKHNKES